MFGLPSPELPPVRGTMSHLDSGFAGGDEDTPKTHTPLAAKAPRIVGHDMS